ncbi:MAG: insulinase family protein [Planctomycetes bacterium]|nr:insulinase family protein [Planctomycetota bacterium]
MAEQVVDVHKLSNGMTLVVEPMKEVSSAAFMFLLPMGVAFDPAEKTGMASVLSELVYRGAGEMDNRQLSESLDGLGLHRHSGIATLFGSFGGALVGGNLLEALKLHGEILRRPRLAEKQFEACRELAIQSLDSLEDDPRHKISLLVKEKYLPYPFGRPAPGKRDELQVIRHSEVVEHWGARATPANMILSVAGKIYMEPLVEAVEHCFGDWEGDKPAELERGEQENQVFHQPYDGAQMHIGVMYRSVAYQHEDYYAALAAVSVLSGGMGSRLFTEVREKRGLCYAVGAAHQVIGGYGTVQGYLGSTPERAQEALDVMLEELRKLSDGITENELDRAKVGLRSSLIMQGESTTARAVSCASDYYHLGRVRSLQEIEEKIINLTVQDVVDHAKRFKPKDFTIVTIGPEKLNV